MGLANRLCEFAAQLGFVLELHLAEIVCIPQRLDDFETICRCCKPLDYELFRQNISSIGSNRTLKSVKQSLESRYQLLKSQVACINSSERLLRDRYIIHEKLINLEEMESKEQALVELVYHLNKIGNELRVCNIPPPEFSDLDSVLIEVNGTCFAIKDCENNLLDIYNVHQSLYFYAAKESHVIGTLENNMAAASIQQLMSETCCSDESIFEDQSGHNRAIAEIDSYFATELHRLSEINEINALELEFTEKRSEILEKSAALQAEFVRGLDLQYESLKFVENINTEINEINLASSKYEKKIPTLFKILTALNEGVPQCDMRKAKMPETCEFEYCWNSFTGLLEIKKRLGRSPNEVKHNNLGLSRISKSLEFTAR